MRRQHAFTMIEIIVVITIIVILMTMLVVGLRYISASSKEKTTRVTLANAQAMLTEFETSAGLSRMPAQAIDAPDGLVTEGGDRRDDVSIRRTAYVMNLLRAVPKNKTSMDQLPAQQLLQMTDSDGKQGVVLLDAWENPIIFVTGPNLSGDWDGPPAWTDRYGFREVDVKDGESNRRVVNPGGIDLSSRDLYPSEPSSASEFPAKLQRLRHFRPFFVSAGPDGDFRTHDDNLYSFEN